MKINKNAFSNSQHSTQLICQPISTLTIDALPSLSSALQVVEDHHKTLPSVDYTTDDSEGASNNPSIIPSHYLSAEHIEKSKHVNLTQFPYIYRHNASAETSANANPHPTTQTLAPTLSSSVSIASRKRRRLSSPRSVSANLIQSNWNEFEEPDRVETLMGVAIILHCQLMRDKNSNELKVRREVKEFDDPLSPFPILPNVYNYLFQAFQLGEFPSSIAIIALLYTFRFLTRVKIQFTERNWKNLFFVAVNLAQKLYDDTPLINSDFVYILPALSIPINNSELTDPNAIFLQRFNNLELLYCELMEYEFLVTTQVYAIYYFELRHVAAQAKTQQKQTGKTNEGQIQLTESPSLFRKSRSQQFSRYESIKRPEGSFEGKFKTEIRRIQ